MPRAGGAGNFEEIAEFAEIGQFIDTPVKRYSSGMYVRLAFSVAAHLEPEILLIDEVLAVGDIEFQKKCLGKMEEVSKKEGRTILFVSHSTTYIKNICTKAIVLESGKIINSGNVYESIQCYFNLLKEEASHHYINYPDTDKTKIKEVYITDGNENILQTITADIEEAFLVFL